MGLYGLAAASGPALAPVISGYAVVANGWRWAFWIMLWLSGFSLALLAFTMPEVSPIPRGMKHGIWLIIDLIREHPLQACSPTKEIDWKRQDQIPRRNRFIPHVFQRYCSNDPPPTTHYDFHRTNRISYRSIHWSHLRNLVFVLRVIPDCLPRGLHVPYCQLEPSFLGIVGW